MSCSSCNKTNPILTCTEILTVGTGALSTAYYLFIRNNSTGRTYRYATTSDGAGLITQDISTQQWSEGLDYEVWITLATATNEDARENFTVDGTSIQCLAVRFKRAYDSANALISDDQTLALEV